MPPQSTTTEQASPRARGLTAYFASFPGQGRWQMAALFAIMAIIPGCFLYQYSMPLKWTIPPPDRLISEDGLFVRYVPPYRSNRGHYIFQTKDGRQIWLGCTPSVGGVSCLDPREWDTRPLFKEKFKIQYFQLPESQMSWGQGIQGLNTIVGLEFGRNEILSYSQRRTQLLSYLDQQNRFKHSVWPYLICFAPALFLLFVNLSLYLEWRRKQENREHLS